MRQLIRKVEQRVLVHFAQGGDAVAWLSNFGSFVRLPSDGRVINVCKFLTKLSSVSITHYRPESRVEGEEQ